MKCFTMMPFAVEFDDVYDCIKNSVRNCLPDIKIDCVRLDDLRKTSKISKDLLDAMHHSSLCIADVTGNNPNVMWETGYIMALSKPLVLITQDINELPFDIKDIRVNSYSRNSLIKTLAQPLAEAVKSTLGERAEFIRENSKSLAPKKRFSIAVTGSMNADPVKCRRRLDLLLNSHLSESTTWYCGSYGAVDEAALNFLTSNNQHVVVVGYHAYDISPPVKNLVVSHNIDFIDASKEQIPRIDKYKSERDVIFLTRTDLLVALWDGQSEGTRELMQWYQSQEKDILIGFV